MTLSFDVNPKQDPLGDVPEVAAEIPKLSDCDPPDCGADVTPHLPLTPGFIAATEDKPEEEEKAADEETDGFDRDEDDDGLITWTEVEQPLDDFDENDFDDDFDDDFEIDIESEEFDERDGDLEIEDGDHEG